MPSAPDLLPMQLLLLPEFLHFLGFLSKGLSQLDVTLSHIVYLCKENKYTYIYIFLKRLLRKPAFLADIRVTRDPFRPWSHLMNSPAET